MPLAFAKTQETGCNFGTPQEQYTRKWDTITSLLSKLKIVGHKLYESFNMGFDPQLFTESLGGPKYVLFLEV